MSLAPRATARKLTAPTALGARALPATAHAAAATKDTWILWLWCTYLLLKPFYVFESGLPQLADYLVAMLVATLAITKQTHATPAAARLLRAQGAMVAYFVAVNITWSIYSGETEMVMYPAYYVFNLLGCLLFANLYGRFGNELICCTGWAVFCSVVLQALMTTEVIGRHESRATLYFNNPNQLGYYTVLFSSLFWLWSQSNLRGFWQRMVVESIFYGAAIYLACLTLSRATLASLGVLILMRILMRQRLTMGILVIGCLTAVYALELEIVADFQQRVESKDIGTEDELLHRGYDRLINEARHLVFGAGEGANSRFWRDYEIELHSSLGTVLFCYGAIGLALFLRVYWTVGRVAGWRSLAFLLPATMYGLTHNGLRQLEFWLLMLVVVVLFQQPARQHRPSIRQFPTRSTLRQGSHA